MHIGGASSGIKKKSQNITTANLETKKRLQHERFEAMKIFYRKNYQKQYPSFIYRAVMKGITSMQERTLASLKVLEK